METTRKTMLVTGGAGFIGAHICRKYLAEGHRVICLDNLQTVGSSRNIDELKSNPEFLFIQHDIIQPLPRLPKLDWIINLACAGSYTSYQYNPVHTMRTNTEGVIRLLDLARASKARFLQSSTSEIYGDPNETPQKETYWGNVNTLGPRACYDEGKRAAETLCMDYHREYGVDVKIIRIFNTYGPFMAKNDGRAVSNFISRALEGKAISIYGDGTATRSFQYVDDLIEGIDKMMQAENFVGPVNLGNPGEISMTQLAELIKKMTGSSSNIVYERAATDDPKRRCPDISLAKDKLGWAPTISVEEGLTRTIAYFKNLPQETRRMLVFVPTFYPIEGPAEVAARDLMSHIPEMQFDVLTSKFSKTGNGAMSPVSNVTIHRLGFGVPLDKYLLPFLGFVKAQSLIQKNRYELMWSVMASYAGIAAIFSKRFNRRIPLLVSLADHRITEGRSKKFTWLIRRILARADRVVVSDPEQEKQIVALVPQATMVRTVGSGDALSGQIRYLYSELLDKQNKKIARAK